MLHNVFFGSARSGFANKQGVTLQQRDKQDIRFFYYAYDGVSLSFTTSLI